MCSRTLRAVHEVGGAAVRGPRGVRRALPEGARVRAAGGAAAAVLAVAQVALLAELRERLVGGVHLSARPQPDNGEQQLLRHRPDLHPLDARAVRAPRQHHVLYITSQLRIHMFMFTRTDAYAIY